MAKPRVITLEEAKSTRIGDSTLYRELLRETTTFLLNDYGAKSAFRYARKKRIFQVIGRTEKAIQNLAGGRIFLEHILTLERRVWVSLRTPLSSRLAPDLINALEAEVKRCRR